MPFSSGKTSLQKFSKFIQIFHLSLILLHNARSMKHFEIFALLKLKDGNFSKCCNIWDFSSINHA